MLEWSSPGPYYLLGVVAHGHWEILAGDRNETDPQVARRGDSDAVNMGIAIVTPAKKVREVLFQHELAAMMERADQSATEGGGVTTPESGI